ncbi:hypothetical protein BSZ35_08360 [Salinibacter sp. 10B]|uniref:hypothetical protein n=1 Tax=Salinibacter sp. 10B TaxID=1923971 RepID=UPI000D2B48A2|nr:hypothetical protein [Salinibacter sp. 10B]PQJ36379.1 hypothetical protein BSZ35_08360 [Salinibacter sp. 10B]
MPLLRLRLFFLIGVFGLCALPAAAQSENVTTVEGADGEQMTLTAQPHSVADGLSVRAMGIEATDTATRWVLSLIGADPEDEISLTYGDQSLRILEVNRPDDGVGPTKVYVTQEDFLTMAETGTVTLTVGDVSTTLPEQLRREMRMIFDKIT